MRIFIDTEFFEDGQTIDLMSIGLIREDGQQLYLINKDCDWRRPLADPWHIENTIPSLTPFSGHAWVSKKELARRVHVFCSFSDLNWKAPSGLEGSVSMTPEFWADFAAYDWVALCQLYGRMVDLPKGWPMFCNDFQQLRAQHNYTPHAKIEEGCPHNAIFDAIVLKLQFEQLMKAIKAS